MTYHQVVNLTWYLGTALQVAVAAAMAWRRSYRQLPIFFAYSVFIVLKSAVTYFLRPYAWPFFYAGWAAEVVAWALCLASIQEVLQWLCSAYGAIRELVNILFRWGGAVLVALAIFTAYAAPGTHPSRMMAGLLVLERSVRIVQVGLLSLIFVFARFLRLRWPHYAFGVAFGFGIFCSIELAMATVRASNLLSNTTAIIVTSVAFAVAQIIWITYLGVPEAAHEHEVPASPKMGGWNLALAELLRR